MVRRRLTVLLAVAGVIVPFATVVAQTPVEPPGAEQSGRVTPDGPYRSRMRIVGDDEPASQPADTDGLLDSLDDDPYRRALLLRQLGHAAAKDGDLAGAAERFEQALQTGALAPSARAQMRASLGALYAAAGNYELAVRALAPLLESGETVAPTVLFSAAYAFAQTGREADALSALERALGAQPDPPSSWLELKAWAERRLGRFDAAAATLSVLTGRDPGRVDYWQQRAAMLQAAGRNDRALDVLLAADALGLLNGSDAALTLVRSGVAAGMPYTSAHRLRAAIDAGIVQPTTEHLRLEADAWLLARDYRQAAEALRTAAERARDPGLFTRLGDLEREFQRWREAAHAYEAAARLDGPGAARALLALGEARYRAGDRIAARRAFERAAGFGGVYRAAADWLAFLGETAPDAPTVTADARPHTAIDPSPGDDSAAAMPPADAAADPQTPIVTARIDAPPTPEIPVKTVPAERYYVGGRTVDAASLRDEAVRLGRQLRSAVRRQRIAVDGPLHLFLDGVTGSASRLDLSVGVPVRGSAPPSGPFNARRFDDWHCAYRVFVGQPEELPAAWRVFIADVAAAGLPVTGSGRQVWLVRGGGDTPDRIEMQIGLGKP